MMGGSRIRRAGPQDRATLGRLFHALWSGTPISAFESELADKLDDRRPARCRSSSLWPNRLRGQGCKEMASDTWISNEQSL